MIDFVIFLLNLLTQINLNLFYKHEYENKIKFFSNNKLKLQPRT